MTRFICETCGSQFTPSVEPPPGCPICQDERQFVPPGGQRWTTLDALARRHFNSYRQHEPSLIGIGTEPKFSIGQRALLLRTPGGKEAVRRSVERYIAIIKGDGTAEQR